MGESTLTPIGQHIADVEASATKLYVGRDKTTVFCLPSRRYLSERYAYSLLAEAKLRAQCECEPGDFDNCEPGHTCDLCEDEARFEGKVNELIREMQQYDRAILADEHRT